MSVSFSSDHDIERIALGQRIALDLALQRDAQLAVIETVTVRRSISHPRKRRQIADESLTWGSVTVSASDGYVRDGITHVDLRIEDDELDTETNMTVLIFYVEGDQEGPGLIVGVIPEYPCLVGAAAVRQELHGE